MNGNAINVMKSIFSMGCFHCTVIMKKKGIIEKSTF